MYIMSCGCELEESQLKRKGNKKTCIEHGGNIIMRKGYCKNDGNVFYRKLVGQLGFLCDDCVAKALESTKIKFVKQRKKTARLKKAKEKRIEAMLAENRRISEANRKTKIIDDAIEVKPEVDYRDHTTRGDYCACAITCRLDGNPKCLDCDRMIPIFRGVDPGRMEQWTI
jgi:hypothetical protein